MQHLAPVPIVMHSSRAIILLLFFAVFGFAIIMYRYSAMDLLKIPGLGDNMEMKSTDITIRLEPTNKPKTYENLYRMSIQGHRYGSINSENETRVVALLEPTENHGKKRDNIEPSPQVSSTDNTKGLQIQTVLKSSGNTVLSQNDLTTMSTRRSLYKFLNQQIRDKSSPVVNTNTKNRVVENQIIKFQQAPPLLLKYNQSRPYYNVLP